MSKLYDLLSAMCGKIKKPDWNQNDSAAPDYVKNRPFYTGDPVDTEIIHKTTVAFTSLVAGLYYAAIQSTFNPAYRETYKVSWDGAEYECVCKDFNGYHIIGNLSIIDGGADTGEPFIIIPSVDGSGIEIYTSDTSASHTFSISGFVKEVVKIDEKYLPEYSVVYSGDPTYWSKPKEQQMYDDFNSGKLVLYQYSHDKIGIVLSVFYSKTVGLQFVFFENNNCLRTFADNAFSERLELSESGINRLIDSQIKDLTTWTLYKAIASETSVGDLLSANIGFDSGTNKACITTVTKRNGSLVETGYHTIVTNGDSDIVLSSSTADSTKKFKITVDDTGMISATEVTA